jgi:hypothetical protein
MIYWCEVPHSIKEVHDFGNFTLLIESVAK